MYSKEELKAFIRKHIDSIEPFYPSTIAGSIETKASEGHHHLLRPNIDLDPKMRQTILRWRCGNIARHQSCKQCNQMLSREHAVSCSGAFAYLKEFYPHVIVGETMEHGKILRILELKMKMK
ncbi:hypothetical protein ROZALSC1DRAFT_26256 [Rozella allomycis CSF55]|uniref:Uncharacterized protein n=1 Tax=Rozella allomycis (strain CSF55) TaxID=988480 RepID=A0A4P9YBV9_ROZAC|nr:hypothetical protein ROZALSC1DRAFT_26256 [Rozella allomycis CSF55]